VGDTIQDVVSDPARHRVYFSVRNEVAVLSADTYLLEKELFLGTHPTGMALSADDQKLYVALGTGGSIVVVNLNTLEWTTVEVATQLGTYVLSDVLEVRPGVVLVSGHFLVTVDTQNGNQVSVVAGGLNADSGAWLHKSFDGRYVYVSDLFTDDLYQLDNSSPALPVVMNAGTIGAGSQFVLNKPGNWLIEGGGSIYDTSAFTHLRTGFTDGIIGEEADGSAIMQQGGSANWSLLDGSTLQETARYLTDCPMISINEITPVGLRGEWLINLANGDLCAISTTTPSVAPGSDGQRALTAWPITSSPVPTVETVVGFAPDHMVLDEARDLFYVSMPLQKQIVLVAAREGGIVGTISMPGQPGTVVMSGDGGHLYVGMHDSGDVAVVDLSSRQIVQTVDLTALVGKPAIGSILELTPGTIIVGAYLGNDPNVTYTYVAEVDLSDPSAAGRIGNPQGYDYPGFVESPDGHFLYIGGSCCAGALEKRDLTSADLALVMTSPTLPSQGHINLYHAVFSADGSRLYAEGDDGNVHGIDTSTLVSVADMGSSYPFLSTDGTKLLTVGDATMATWDLATYQLVGLVQGNCTTLDIFYGAGDYAMFADRAHFAVLSVGSLDSNSPGSVCVMNSTP
jgi:hypothetical protein